MAKMKNQRIYSTAEHLQMLAEEHRLYTGRDYKLDLNSLCLTVFALPKRHKKSKKSNNEKKHERNKREEKFERRA